MQNMWAQKAIDGNEEDLFEIAAAVGSDFAILACQQPSVLRSLLQTWDTMTASRAYEAHILKQRLLLTASVGRGLQQELFKTKANSGAQLLISQLRRQAPRKPAVHNLWEVTIMANTFCDPDARDRLGSFLHNVRGQSEYGALLPYLTSFAHVLHGDTAALHPDDIVCHPVLIAAFDALASRDEAVLDAAVFAILAALDLASYAGTLVEGKQALCLFLVGMISKLTPWMEHFASTTDGSNDTQAAAYAKLLAAGATAFISPLHSFLEGAEPQALIRGMVAIRAYPAASIAAEGALFWRILRESLEMSRAYAWELKLQDAQAMGDLIQKLYLRLLDALYSSTILPEHAWESVTPKEQAFMLHRREAIAEALLEVAGVLGFESCMEEVMAACNRRQGRWTPQEAVLACINLLHRASPPLAQPTLVFVFERLCSLPRIGNLTATATTTATLYTQWVIATAQEAPEGGADMLEQFCLFLDTEEVKAQKAHSEASELESEETPECSTSAADTSDAESWSESEQDLANTADDEELEAVDHLTIEPSQQNVPDASTGVELEAAEHPTTEPFLVVDPSTVHSPENVPMVGHTMLNNEDGSGTMDQIARAVTSTSAMPETFLGKMCWAAGALVGTVQGCAKLFI